MQAAIDQLRSNIAYVRNIGGLYASISGMTTPALDLSDLLRTQLVMCVSALDHYVHEATRLGMIETLDGKRTPTPAFLRYDVTIGNALQALGSAGSVWLEDEIRTRHSYLSFQQPDKIADAIRLITQSELWNSLGTLLSDTPQNLKKRLRLIVDRRNKIVHEADLDPTYPGTNIRWPITPQVVNDSVSFVERLCEAIDSLL